jgi:hypothetical protein
MAVRKTVAELSHSDSTPNPTTASTAGELKAGSAQTETVEQTVSNTADADLRARRAAGLAKARAIKAAKTAQVAAELNAVTAALAAKEASDKAAFGTIQEVAKTLPTLDEYVKIEIPAADLFDHQHPGVQLNRHKFEAGKTYLLRGDVALEVKRRLAMFHDEQVRLLRPNADRKALADVNRGSQWSSRGSSVQPLNSLEDVPVASDEKVYTIEF